MLFLNQLYSEKMAIFTARLETFLFGLAIANSQIQLNRLWFTKYFLDVPQKLIIWASTVMYTTILSHIPDNHSTDSHENMTFVPPKETEM